MAFPFLDSPGRPGVVSGSYSTRSGETVWLIDWADKKKTPPVEVRCKGDFRVGQRVLLVDGRLIPAA